MPEKLGVHTIAFSTAHKPKKLQAIRHIYQQMYNSKIKNRMQSTRNCYVFRRQAIIFKDLQENKILQSLTY